MSGDQQLDQGVQQCFAALARIMNKLKEAQIQRQFLLRDATVRSQPTPEQGPKAFQRVDMHLAQPLSIFIAGIVPLTMVDRFVGVAPRFQTTIESIRR